MLDVIVVGAGLFGAAAARHLAAASAKVAVIGPAGPESGTYSSHDDQSRIVRRTTRDLPWAILTDRSIRAYERLQAETGVTFFHHRDGAHLVPDGRPSAFLDAAGEIVTALGVPRTLLESGADVRAAIPALSVPASCRGFIEHAPAGILEPRKLIAAQLAGTGEVIREVAVSLRSSEGHVEVVTDAGRTYRAGHALLAIGAYARDPRWLPRRLDLRVKSETTILAEVSEREAARLAGFPTLVYERPRDRLGTIYMAPPLRYPDGRLAIKMGCDTFADRELADAGELDAWMRAGESDVARDEMVAALRGLIAGLELRSVRTKRCLVTYTPRGWPLIDRVADRISVVAGGDGFGAKASDAIGALAAEVVAQGRIRDVELDAALFAARYAS